MPEQLLENGVTLHLVDARFRAFDASSHVPFWEEPEAFNAALDQFVAGLEPAT